MDASVSTRPAHRLQYYAQFLLRPLAEGLAGLLVTGLLVAALAELVLARVSLQGFTLNILLRNLRPFGNLGTREAFALALGRSGVLLLTAFALAALVGVGAGIVYALSGSRPIRAVAWTLGTAGVALPSFFWAMLLQLAVIALFARTGRLLLPTQGYGLDRHVVLPALALGVRPVAYLFRTTAAAVEEARHAEYVRLARAKGLGEGYILRRHLLPTTAGAVLGGMNLAARGTLSSLAIIEYVFDWHGAGFGFIYAVANGDRHLATALVVAFAVLFALVGSATTIGARLLDPRLER